MRAPVDHAREHVAPEPVGAEEEERAPVLDAHQVEARLELPPEPVGVARAQEPQPVAALRILAVLPLEVLHVEPVVQAVHERADELPVVEEPHRLGRRVDEVAVARVQVVGGDDLAHQHREVQQGEHRPGGHREVVAPEPPPHHPPLRGQEEPLLLRGQSLDGVRVERLGRDVVLETAAGRVSRHVSPARMSGMRAALSAEPLPGSEGRLPGSEGRLPGSAGVPPA